MWGWDWIWLYLDSSEFGQKKETPFWTLWLDVSISYTLVIWSCPLCGKLSSDLAIPNLVNVPFIVRTLLNCCLHSRLSPAKSIFSSINIFCFPLTSKVHSSLHNTGNTLHPRGFVLYLTINKNVKMACFPCCYHAGWPWPICWAAASRTVTHSP